MKLFYTQGFNKDHLECLPFRATNSLASEPRTGMKEVCRSGCVTHIRIQIFEVTHKGDVNGFGFQMVAQKMALNISLIVETINLP